MDFSSASIIFPCFLLSLRRFPSWRQLSRGWCEAVVANTAAVAHGRLVVAVTQELTRGGYWVEDAICVEMKVSMTL